MMQHRTIILFSERIPITTLKKKKKRQKLLILQNDSNIGSFSTSSFLPQIVLWQQLRGAASPVCSELSTPNGPFPCWPQTLPRQASSGPRQARGDEARTRRWAKWGSGRNPRSARRPESGEMKARWVWSWRRSWWRNWREEKWRCRKEALLLWLYSDWAR